MEETTAKVFFNGTLFALGWTAAYLNIDVEAIALYTILMVMDYITGMSKAWVMGRSSITSKRMGYGVVSKLSLMMIPLAMAVGAKALGSDFSMAIDAGLKILILSELYSVIGNIYTIKTRKSLPEYDAVAMIGKNIRNVLLRLGGEER